MKSALRSASIAAAFAGIVSGVAAQNIPKPEPPPPPRAAAKATETWGTTNYSYYRMAASEFTPLQTAGAGPDTYFDNYFDAGGVEFGRWGILPQLVASPHLPSGARLTYLELDACDSDLDLNILLDMYSCDYSGICDPTPIHLTSATNVAPGCSYTNKDLTSSGIVVNNLYGQLTFKVELQSDNSDPSFRGLVIGYVLQVAPPPLVATFADVPVSDPGFQYIEALAASGVTGGTGGGNFSPNAPVTRRQMAIFLAKALGIYSLGY